MKQKLSHFFWEGFKQAQGMLSTIGTFLIAILLWKFTPSIAVPLYIVITTWVISLISIISLIYTICLLYNSFSPTLPKVIYSKPSVTNNENEKKAIDCLLEPSVLYSHDSFVSFFFKDSSGFEQDIGIGFVTNIQDDKNIKATLIYSVPGQEEIIDKLSKNDSAIHKSIIVKPIISRAYKKFIME